MTGRTRPPLPLMCQTVQVCQSEVVYWKGKPGLCACGQEREFLNRPLIVDGSRPSRVCADADLPVRYVLNSYSRVMIGPWYHDGVPGEIDRMYSWVDDLVVANYRPTEAYPHSIYLPIIEKDSVP